MEEIVKIASIGICGSVIAAVLKNQKSEFVIPVMLASGIVMMFFILDKVVLVNQNLIEFATNYNIDISYIKIILKVICIAYVCQFACDVLKDSGFSSLALKVELAARLIIFSYAFPIATELLKKTAEIVSKL